MPIFSKKSGDILLTCCHEIQLICNKAIPIYDFTVIWGIRAQEEQDRLFHQGLSTKQYPDSKHNVIPPQELSDAVDIAPYPVNWKDLYRFIFLAGIMFSIAKQENINLRWGGNWDMDTEIISDQTFQDLCHYEIIR